MKTKGMRLVSAILALVMVLGVLATLPFTASAYHTADTAVADGSIQGTALPDDAKIYDGTPSTSLQGTGTEQDPFLIANAADFVYFRDVHIPSLAVKTTVTVNCTAEWSAAKNYTTTVTDENGEVISTETKSISNPNAAKNFVTVCTNGDHVDEKYYYKLTGDIYLNDAAYGAANTHNNFSDFQKTQSNSNSVVFSPDANGNLSADFTRNTELAANQVMSVTPNGDGTTTTIVGEKGSVSVIQINTFEGVLDGDGHTIYNLYSSNSHSAIFSEMNGTVKNLNIDGARIFINGNITNGAYRSLLAETIHGNVQNVHIKNAALMGHRVAGFGVFAKDNTLIDNCSFSGTINATEDAGAFIAIYNDESKSGPLTIQNCINYGAITSTGPRVGGILGAASATGSVSGVNITNCKNYGNITGTTNVAGITGAHYRVKDFVNYDYCVNYGTVTATGSESDGFAGGILGNETSGGGSLSVSTYIRNCTNQGDVSGTTVVGGIVASHVLAGKYLNIYDCANYGKIDGNTASGGMVGQVSDEWGNGGALNVINSANYGAIGSAGTSAVSAAVCGMFSFAKVKITLDGYLSTGDITATTSAAAILGKSTNSATQIAANDVWIKAVITVTGAGQAAIANANAVVTGGTVTLKDTGFSLTFSVNGEAVDASTIPTSYVKTGTTLTGYNDGTVNVTESAYPAVAEEKFFTAAVASLNTASDGDYNTWAIDPTYGVVFKFESVLTIVNAESLTHNYNGKAVEVLYIINDFNIVSVDVKYYDVNDLETPLPGAPVKPGTYRVVLQGKNGLGDDQGAALTEEYTIAKGVINFELVQDGIEDVKFTTVYNPTPWKDANAVFVAKTYDFRINIFEYTNSIRGETLLSNVKPTKIVYNPLKDNSNTSWGGAKDITEGGTVFSPGLYFIDFVYEENELYLGKSGQVKFCIHMPFAGVSMSMSESLTLNWKIDESAFAYYAEQGDVTLYLSIANVKQSTPAVKTREIGPDGEYHTYYNVSCDVAVTDFEYEKSYRFIITTSTGESFSSAKEKKYAPLNYAYEVYAANKNNEEMTTLLTNMVDYAYQAEIYDGTPISSAWGSKNPGMVAQVNSLNGTWSGKGASFTLASTVTLPENMDNFCALTDEAEILLAKDMINNFVDTGLSTNGHINLVFGVKAGSSVASIRANFGSHMEKRVFEANEAGFITVSGLNASNILTKFKLEFLDAEGNVLAYTDAEGNEYTEVTFSIGNYLQRIIGDNADAKATSLASSMVLYMMSARAYVQSQN